MFIGGLAGSAVRALRADNEDLCWLTLEQAGEMVRRKKTSPVELTRACLHRIEKLNPSLNAFITVTADTALSQAKEREAELRAGRPRGPLHGIPIALKDLIDTAGVRTTAGSKEWADRIPTKDAEVVRRLKEGGAILLGKLNMDEFAYNYTAETSAYGPSRNPWDRQRSPGGSSGGSAVAVAAGMCFAALGSDTGGSIRLPAALCGISGFKPTYGRVSTHGVAPLAWSLDHLGPMCRTARDAASMFSAMAGLSSPGRLVDRDIKSVRLGVPRAVFYEKLHPEVESTLVEAVRALGRLTSGVREVRLPELQRSSELSEFPLAYVRIISAEAYAFHEETLKREPSRYDPRTRKTIEAGATITAAEYVHARREMDRLRAESARLFEEADLLVTPAAPAPAFVLGEPAGLIFLRNAAPWNLYGLPSISIPCGFTAGGLPVGMQITGAAGRDDLVLSAAAAYQRVTNWHARHPSI